MADAVCATGLQCRLDTVLSAIQAGDMACKSGFWISSRGASVAFTQPEAVQPVGIVCWAEGCRATNAVETVQYLLVISSWSQVVSHAVHCYQYSQTNNMHHGEESTLPHQLRSLNYLTLRGIAAAGASRTA